jgi:hypothetical protein
MKNEDLQTFTRRLQDVEVDLPLHQKALRARLLAMHAQGRTSPRFSIAAKTRRQSIRAGNTSKSRVRIGTVVITLSLIAIGLLVLRPAMAENPARQLATAAAYKVQRMNPEKLELISKNYGALDECLQEALHSKSLHVATKKELDSLLTPELKKEYPLAKVYLAFTNSAGHRIFIALDAANEPLYAIDVDKLQAGDRY